MLYILPPLRTQNPPAPWSNLICGNGNGNGSTNIDRSSWDNDNNKRPPRIQLRNIQIVKNEDESSGIQDEMDANRNPKSLSECYFAGKGTALVLPDAEAHSKTSPGGSGGQLTGDGCGGGGAQGNGNIQKHLQSMFYLLRPEETLKMAVKLESVHPTRTRYLVVVSRMGSRGEESCLLGIDCNEKTTVGLVLRVLANTQITLDGDGGFSVSVCERHHIFKPVSVQAMWSALQNLHKVSAKAREQNYFQGGMTHGWVDYYEKRIESERSCLNEWHAMDSLESRRPPSPDSIRTKPTERDETEKVIRSTLKEIMMSVDLDEVTSKVIRSRLEDELDMDLGEYKSFIDQEMLVILGQMDAPTEIFDHVYLGSEWNASNYEELQRNRIGYILNVSKEIDNFFPGAFDYLNVRVYDDETTDLLKHWDNTYKYITKARETGSKVLVHCKMGVSRSASVVIAYAMKAYSWDFQTALTHVKEKRNCIKPNMSFLSQLETYQGILDAMKNKEKLQRSKSETNLKSPGSKSEKVLAGSEPTPVVQALTKSYDLEVTLSGQDLRNLGARPKSWSPDNITARELAVRSSPISSVSLEDVSQKSSSKESVRSLQHHVEMKSSLARHVLMPCDNGESYSVSPNQIVHLPGHDPVSSCKVEKKLLVLDLSARFEQSDQEIEVEASDNSSCNVSSSETDNKLETDDVKKETWDPGESTQASKVSYCSSTSDFCDLKTSSVSENQTVWTSSTTLKTECAVPFSCSNSLVKVPDTQLQTVRTKTVTLRKDSDPFSNQLDRVFDREEKKQQRMSTIPLISTGCPPELSNEEKDVRECPSRQNSWSSYDSAVVLGFPNETELSRQSSWGSGDTRTLPSRNSSWGSYDTRRRGPVHYVNEKGEKVLHNPTEMFENSSSGMFPYDKEDIPWHPGTVKRTKQKIEECTRKPSGSDSLTSSCISLAKTPSSETLLFDFVPDKENPVEAVNTVLIEAASSNSDNVISSAISEKIDIPGDDHKQCSSPRLSISAPVSSSMELVTKECSLSRSASNVSAIGKLPKDSSSSVICTAQCSSVKQHRTLLENLQNLQDSQYMTKKSDDLFDSSNHLGKVMNLRKEFEAKSSTNTEQNNTNNVETSDSFKTAKNKINSLPSSPVSVHQDKEKKEEKGDDLKLKNLIGKFEPNKEETPQVNLRQKFSTSSKVTQNQNNRNSYMEVSERKPERITQTPLISNLNKNGSPLDKSDSENKKPPISPTARCNLSRSMVVATVVATATKKQQQYGKSHPLSKLNIKSRHNNSVYNTM